MLTEAEAKTKWCPFVRQSATFDGGYAVSYNRSANSPALAAPCIGSACMAFRQEWERKDQAAGLPPPGPDWVKDGRDYGQGGAVTHRQVWKRAVGYCGLAGRPA